MSSTAGHQPSVCMCEAGETLSAQAAHLRFGWLHTNSDYARCHCAWAVLLASTCAALPECHSTPHEQMQGHECDSPECISFLWQSPTQLGLIEKCKGGWGWGKGKMGFEKRESSTEQKACEGRV